MKIEALVKTDERIVGAIASGPYRRTNSYLQAKLTSLRVDTTLMTPEEKSRLLRTAQWKDAKARVDRLATLGQGFVIQSKDRIYFHSHDPKNRLWLTRAK